MKNPTFLISVLSSFAFSCFQAQAATIHSEVVNGELSISASTPTQLGTLSLGDNDVIGQIGGGARDYFTFSVASGQTLDSITLVSGTGTNHFFGLDDQATFNDGGGFLIGTLFSGAATESADFLDTFAGGGGFGGSGVTGSSLGSGDYTILVNETAGGSFDYQLRLTAVPEPSSSALLGLAGIAMFVRRRR